MSDNKMHSDEVETNISLVKHLLENQFPHWSRLTVKKVKSAGTDNALYRLGEDMVLRLPRIPATTAQVAKEQQYLAKLAPHLPLEIPTPLAKGMPDATYPFPWSIYRWLEGENATIDRLSNPLESARQLAQFILALQKIDTTGAPLPGAHNFGRGIPLAERDRATRTAIDSLETMIDTNLAQQVWQVSLDVPVWDKAPVWIHGDLQSGNLLAQNGRLSAVIDFGALAIADPACDLMIAWNLFSGHVREAFRDTLQIDDATWARGRGWALSVGLIALPYYHKTNPILAGISRVAINAVLEDFRANGL